MKFDLYFSIETDQNFDNIFEVFNSLAVDNFHKNTAKRRILANIYKYLLLAQLN
jgi:hypothetical protein